MIGVGIDLIIAYPESWWTVSGVIICSSFGIIGRSLWNESNGTDYFNSHKMKQGLEDCTAITRNLIAGLTQIVETGSLPQKELTEIARLLSLTYRLKDTFIRARRESAKRRR